jgi:hypothetical protein
MKPMLLLITAAVSLLISPRESAAEQRPPAKGLVIVAPLRFHKALEAFAAQKQEQLPTERP